MTTIWGKPNAAKPRLQLIKMREGALPSSCTSLAPVVTPPYYWCTGKIAPSNYSLVPYLHSQQCGPSYNMFHSSSVSGMNHMKCTPCYNNFRSAKLHEATSRRLTIHRSPIRLIEVKGRTCHKSKLVVWFKWVLIVLQFDDQSLPMRFDLWNVSRNHLLFGIIECPIAFSSHQLHSKTLP